jgi:hypothetical protein
VAAVYTRSTARVRRAVQEHPGMAAGSTAFDAPLLIEHELGERFPWISRHRSSLG